MVFPLNQAALHNAQELKQSLLQMSKVWCVFLILSPSFICILYAIKNELQETNE